ncbi:MAG: chloride channel protein [Deltaproteobacteria bacterium]|nr:chloride channel protein [Deltaproteobacteria bacterium]
MRLRFPLPGPLFDAVRSLELRLAGALILRGIAVGVVVGLVACVLYLMLHWSEALLLGGLAGFEPLRPAGDVAPITFPGRRVLWPVLVLLPALGGLATGLIVHKLAPETAGGGGDAYIDAFHRRGGLLRRRVWIVKILATVCTLGTGGSGGREGPTMQIGAGLASSIGRLLGATPRERRVLVVAGTAAGLSAIFGTPLGAALLATEVLYRDDFESDALVPAVFASVTSFSIFVTILPGHGQLFAHAPRYPFEPTHLPLYAGLALVLALVARLFVLALAEARHLFARLPGPPWARPAAGGLALGVVAALSLAIVSPRLGIEGIGVGLLGSGYGLAQTAITGAEWLPTGWTGVALLFAFGVAKVGATSLTLGSGGSGGDFGPSLAIGALLGGAFGRAAHLAGATSVDPGAFALVGMGAFYGGLAHTPLAGLVMVCELAGNYDLLVPLMLVGGLTYVLLRRTGLYRTQPTSRFDSPIHAAEDTLDILKRLRVADVVPTPMQFVTFSRSSVASEILRRVADAPPRQVAFPVIDEKGALVGIVSDEAIRALGHDQEALGAVVADDLMSRPVTVRGDDDLHAALERILAERIREVPVVDAHGVVVGLLDEADISRAYHDYLATLGTAARPSMPDDRDGNRDVGADQRAQ